MQVYLAICDYGLEGPRVLAVCATRELAQKRIDEPHNCAAEDHDIDERELVMSEWQPIETASKEGSDLDKVDLWLQWGAAPSTMGMADSFRVVDAYRAKGKWVHVDGGQIKELNEDYITHWMRRPKGPNGEDHY